MFNQAKLATEKYEGARQKEEQELQNSSNLISNLWVASNRDEQVTITKQQFDQMQTKITSLETSLTTIQSELNGQFSINENITKVSINKPSTWIVGTEYNFGDGIYGQRWAGNMPAIESNNGSRIYTSNVQPSTIINCGGEMTIHNGGGLAVKRLMGHYYYYIDFNTSAYLSDMMCGMARYRCNLY